MTRTPVEPFFEALFARDASGRDWLARLLAAAPHGRERLEELADAPGWLVTPLAVRAVSGRLACFEYSVVPSRKIEQWYIDHPDRLTWVDDTSASSLAVRLRRALVLDDPPGSQVRAQDRARDLLATRSALAREWWRFEEPHRLDCTLITDRLVVTITVADTAPGGGPVAPATPWYPQRSRLVADLEAAELVAAGRAWANLLLSSEPVDGGGDDDLAQTLPGAAPELDDEERRRLRGAYLGNLTWDAACAAVGLEPSMLAAEAGSRAVP